MGQLDGRVAVVTGGGSGIGRAVAERFVAEGAEVVIVGRGKERLDEAVAEIGGNIRGVSCDMGREEQVQQLFEDLPRVDILATFAGGALFGLVDETAIADAKALFEGRFFGQLSAVHHGVGKMPEGSVILLCSGIADKAHVKRYSAGTGLCGAVNALGKNLAVELAPRGIRVNVLSPGLIIPTSIDSNLDLAESAVFLNETLAIIPMARYGEPSDMADAAMFAATCPYLSGQVIEVDGGWTAT